MTGKCQESAGRACTSFKKGGKKKGKEREGSFNLSSILHCEKRTGGKEGHRGIVRSPVGQRGGEGRKGGRKKSRRTRRALFLPSSQREGRAAASLRAFSATPAGGKGEEKRKKKKSFNSFRDCKRAFSFQGREKGVRKNRSTAISRSLLFRQRTEAKSRAASDSLEKKKIS